MTLSPKSGQNVILKNQGGDVIPKSQDETSFTQHREHLSKNDVSQNQDRTG